MAQYVFPEDLTSSYYNHYMIITSYKSDSTYGVNTGALGNIIGSPSVQGVLSGGLTTFNSLTGSNLSTSNIPAGSTYNTAVDQIVLFIPGGVTNAGMLWENQHEYADIRLSNLAGGMLGGSPGGLAATAGAMVGRVMNPGVEVLYRTTKLRDFQFAFLMAPSSERESNTMKGLVKALRKAAAPSADPNASYLFRTPYEFEIKFYHGSNENIHIPKIGRCVLENITVDYAPGGEWSTFTNGHPVSALMTLKFQEMEIMTQEKVNDGY
jgi:hypothetical protein